MSTEFAHCHFDKTGGGVGAGDADADIFVSPDGWDAELPVATGVSADEGDFGKTASEGGDVVGGGFSFGITCGFIPGVLEDDGFEFCGSFDEGIDGGIGAALGDPQFDSQHGAVGDTALELFEAGLGVFGVEIDKTEEAIGKGGDRFEHFVILTAQIIRAGIGVEFESHIDAIAFDAVAVSDFDQATSMFGSGGAFAGASEVAVEIPDHGLRIMRCMKTAG